MKVASILPYMLKFSSLLANGFGYNNKAKEKLFNYMCYFEARGECRSRKRAVSSYIVLDTRKYQDCFLNKTHLLRISGYIMEDVVGCRDLKNMPQIRVKLIHVSISSYLYIIKYPKGFI